MLSFLQKAFILLQKVFVWTAFGIFMVNPIVISILFVVLLWKLFDRVYLTPRYGPPKKRTAVVKQKTWTMLNSTGPRGLGGGKRLCYVTVQFDDEQQRINRKYSVSNRQYDELNEGDEVLLTMRFNSIQSVSNICQDRQCEPLLGGA